MQSHARQTMAFPAFSEFKKALETDDVFVDSFNLFLNLPVFANRLQYVKKASTFKISPYPNSKLLHFDQGSLLQWSYSHRLPLFWVSEFYYGYHLGLVLFDQSSVELTNNHAVSDYISKNSSSKEIQKFLLFLRGTHGESCCLFWLDVERLKHAKQVNKKKEIVDRIKKLYLRNGAPFEFDTSIRRDIYFSSCEAKTLAEEVSIFISSQYKVMPMIKKYWFEKYLQQAIKSSRQSSDISAAASSDAEGSDVEHKQELFDSLPRVIIDEGKEKDENAENQHEELTNLVESQPAYTERSRKQSYHLEMNAGPLFTASTHNLFGLSNQQVSNGVLEPQNQTSFMQASIRCNFAAGNPVLTFFRHKFGNTDEKVADNPINLLILWFSIESLLTRDEMKRWYSSIKSSHLEADCPYFSLFHEYPVATDLDSLLELFIDDNSEFFVNLPIEIQRQLHLLIPKGLGKSLLLETQEYVCKKLQPFWEEYIVHENYLFQSECLKQKDLSHLADVIQQQQSRLYRESCLAKSILHATFDPKDKQEIKKIWKAVEFSEAVINPGLLHLPSRLSMQIYPMPVLLESQKSVHEERSYGTSTPGDVGPISYRGINLIPMVTTVSTKTRRTAFKMVRTTVYSSQPATMAPKLTKKPSVPRSFSEMMKDPDHIESFYNFLASNVNGTEMELVFWLAIEDMKDSIGDTNNCKVKIRRIMRRFFKDGLDMTIYCKDTTLMDLSSSSDPDPFLLMDAQEAISKSLEVNWYRQYLNYLSDSCKNDDIKKYTEKKQQIQIQKSVVRDHTRGLWSMFTKNVIGFRRGLMNPKVLQLFKKYLAQEVLKGDSCEKKKVMGSKVVNVTKLLNDLSFWAEVERYKDMADVVRAAKNSGTYTPEDEIMVYKKAHAIVNCYIDSSVPPKVQVNVTPEIVNMILENLSSSNISRGLFHEAALNIFSILILYWKRFCIWRWSPNKSGSTCSVNSHSTAYSFGGLGINNNNVQPQDSDDMLGGCVLSFSLRKGLRLIVPPNQPILHYPISQRNTAFTKTKVYKIESARAMISKHISRITSTQ